MAVRNCQLFFLTFGDFRYGIFREIKSPTDGIAFASRRITDDTELRSGNTHREALTETREHLLTGSTISSCSGNESLDGIPRRPGAPSRRMTNRVSPFFSSSHCPFPYWCPSATSTSKLSNTDPFINFSFGIHISFPRDRFFLFFFCMHPRGAGRFCPLHLKERKR